MIDKLNRKLVFINPSFFWKFSQPSGKLLQRLTNQKAGMKTAEKADAPSTPVTGPTIRYITKHVKILLKPIEVLRLKGYIRDALHFPPRKQIKGGWFYTWSYKKPLAICTNVCIDSWFKCFLTNSWMQAWHHTHHVVTVNISNLSKCSGEQR